MARRGLANGALLLLSLLLALGAVEAGLRWFYPHYRDAAESRLDPDQERIYKREPHERQARRHPDSGQPFWGLTNALAAHNHREIPPQRWERARLVALFGDSFTANNALPVQYSLQDPLDHLLNAASRPDPAAHPVEVLNFGVNGYGPDQSWLNYQTTPVRDHLQVVVYLFCANDLLDLEQNRLLALDPSTGTIRHTPPPGLPWWVPPLSRLHLTYLLLDVKARLKGRLAGEGESFRAENLHLKYVHHLQTQRREAVFAANRGERLKSHPIEQALASGTASPELERTVALFRALMARWQREVASRGGRFVVALLPRPEEEKLLFLFDPETTVVDLAREFRRLQPGYDYAREGRLQRDGHWNEWSNLLAAVALQEKLAPLLGGAPLEGEALRRQLTTYYGAFGGWRPPAQWQVPIQPDPREGAALRERYLALEKSLGPPDAGTRERPTVSP
ncbi:MAG: SGNH/GDSL hydrolase family protein [Magnetococcales bacterium]|nr:SGNH/GDSL hydrolase family protein [Magnetococcales bacterium]